jgi:hypothetical protein
LRRRRYERDNPHRRHQPPRRERDLHVIRNADEEPPRLTNL